MKSISILAYLNAGGVTGKSTIAKLQAVCNKKNIDFKIYTTKYPKHTKTLIQEVVEKNKYKKNHRIIIIGGDGTLNEAIYGLHNLSEKIPVAYFPSGTGNDFARSLNLTNDVEKFIDRIFDIEAEELEFIEVNTDSKKKYVAMNGLGLGFDALIAHMTNKDIKKGLLSKVKLGKTIYISKIVSAFRNREVFSAKISINKEKEEEHKNILFVSFMKNPYFGGGIKIVPTACKNNGQIALVLAKDISGKDILRLLPHVLTTGKHFEKTPKFTQLFAKEFKITISGEQYLQTDGETEKVRDTVLIIKLSKYPFYLVEK